MVIIHTPTAGSKWSSLFISISMFLQSNKEGSSSGRDTTSNNSFSAFFEMIEENTKSI